MSKDIDVEQNMVIVRSGKGDKDRRTVLPETLKDDLIKHLSEIRSVYDQDRRDGAEGVWLPGAPGEKISERWKGMGLVLAFSIQILLD